MIGPPALEMVQPTALDEDEIVQLYRRLLQAHCVPAPDGWLRLELSTRQVTVLLLLARGAAPDIGSIARAMALSRPAMSQLVEGLVRRGLVARRDDPMDRRRAIVCLTTEGSLLIGCL